MEERRNSQKKMSMKKGKRKVERNAQEKERQAALSGVKKKIYRNPNNLEEIKRKVSPTKKGEEVPGVERRNARKVLKMSENENRERRGRERRKRIKKDGQHLSFNLLFDKGTKRRRTSQTKKKRGHTRSLPQAERTPSNFGRGGWSKKT